MYAVEPIVEITQRGGGWTEIWPEAAVLAGLNVLLVAVLALTISRTRQYAV